MDVFKNLTDFYDRLPTKSIKFIYIARGNTWLSQEAAVLKMNKREYYVRKSDANPSEKFYYIYSITGIMYLLGAYKVQNEPVILYNHSILKQSPNAHAHQGDHLTVGMMKLASMANYKVSTHRTTYTHDSINPNTIVTDHGSYCNFELVESEIKSFKKFQSQSCYKMYPNTIKKTHTIDDQHLIHKFCKEALTAKKNKVVIGGKRFFGEYKGVNYRSTAFTNYIYTSLRLDKLYSLTDFFIIYDENQDNINPHMLVVLQYEGSAFIIYVHTRRVMKAAYAYAFSQSNGPKVNANDSCSFQEKQCLEKMNKAFDTVFAKLGFQN